MREVDWGEGKHLVALLKYITTNKEKLKHIVNSIVRYEGIERFTDVYLDDMLFIVGVCIYFDDKKWIGICLIVKMYFVSIFNSKTMVNK